MSSEPPDAPGVFVQPIPIPWGAPPVVIECLVAPSPQHGAGPDDATAKRIGYLPHTLTRVQLKNLAIRTMSNYRFLRRGEPAFSVPDTSRTGAFRCRSLCPSADHYVARRCKGFYAKSSESYARWSSETCTRVQNHCCYAVSEQQARFAGSACSRTSPSPSRRHVHLLPISLP